MFFTNSGRVLCSQLLAKCFANRVMQGCFSSYPVHCFRLVLCQANRRLTVLPIFTHPTATRLLTRSFDYKRGVSIRLSVRSFSRLSISLFGCPFASSNTVCVMVIFMLNLGSQLWIQMNYKKTWIWSVPMSKDYGSLVSAPQVLLLLEFNPYYSLIQSYRAISILLRWRVYYLYSLPKKRI